MINFAGYYTDQFKKEIHPDKTNIHTQDEMEENNYWDEGLKAKLITGPKLDKNKPDIEHRSNQDNADTNPIEESEQNKYQYQLIEDVATGHCTDQFNNEMFSDKTNMHTQHTMEEIKYRFEGHKGKLITGLKLDKGKPGIDNQSRQTESDTKHIEKCDQITEDDFSTGLQLEEDQPGIEHRSIQDKADTNPIEESEKNNNQYQLIENVATVHISIEIPGLELDEDKPGIEHQSRQDQTDTKHIKERDQMAENDFATGLELDEDKHGIEHQSMQDQTDTKHIKEMDQMAEKDFATECRDGKEHEFANNQQLCQGRDDDSRIERSDDNQCQYKMSGEDQVPASSECTDQNKFISNAGKPNLYPQDEIAQKGARDEGPNADIITASSECTDQNKFISNADKPNLHPQDELAEHRDREEGPNADIITGCSTNEDKNEYDADKTKLETKNVGVDRKPLYERSEQKIIPARHDQTNKSNPDIDNRLQVTRKMKSLGKKTKRTEMETDSKDIKEKTEKHTATTSKQKKNDKSKETADKQYKFEVVVVMLNVLWLKDEKTRHVLLNLHKSVRGVVIAIDANAVDLDLVKTICKDYSSIIGDCMKQTEFCILSEDKETSFSSIKMSIRGSIAKLTADMKPCTLSKQLKDKGYTYSDVDSKYKECKEKAEIIISHIPKSHSTVKDEIVPLQGETWQTWTKCCKTLNKTSQYTSIYEADKVRQHMIELRKTELHICTKLGPFMKSVIGVLYKYLNNDLHFTYLIWWLKFLLDERSRRILPKFLTEYQRDWQALRSVKNNKQHDEIENLKLRLKTSEYNLAEASFGLEHVVREIGQMYEAMIECKRETLSNLGPNSITAGDLATVGAKMLLNGQPFELMDGDTANVPLIWVKAVITELKNMIGDRKLLALSILGVQSSGKSTLLNTMFGVQFAVSAGRCTRGVFMQLVKVEKCSVPVDYIVVFDTEGLRAPN
ncbi:unnamed protein product [Mytilus edulis]|uniref:VLIG-type G domain-containing protein n=1 Tax=Mytilus edulis TaxID=6550 RepID=A0A8S3UNY0_MYTED|nr:unnamed protein product [Mytilus edulis]